MNELMSAVLLVGSIVIFSRSFGPILSWITGGFLMFLGFAVLYGWLA